MQALGPLMEKLGATTKGITYDVGASVGYLRAKNGAVRGGPADGRPSLRRDVHACEAILALSGTTNGHLATQGSGRSRNAPGRCCTTSPPSMRASRSPSPTPRPRPSR
jgi:nitrate reductase alpha subunit